MLIVTDFALRIAVVVSYIVLVIVNIISSIEGSNATVSQKYPTPLTPAGWAFSIWSVIFLFQAIYTIYIALPYGYEDNVAKSKLLRTVSVPMCLAWALQNFWQLFFNGENFTESTVCIVGGFAVWLWTLVEIYAARTELNMVVFLQVFSH
jgi:hypothetical protein